MNEAKPLGAWLPARLRETREGAQRRQQDVADDMQLLGFSSWTRVTVTAVELGRRSLSLEEALVLPAVLDTSLLDLIDRPFVTPGGGVIPPELVRESLTGEGIAPRTYMIESVAASPKDAETKAAARLGLDVEQLTALAHAVWRRSLTEERDARLGDVGEIPARSLQARRGHITRQLLAELHGELEGS